MKKQQKTETLQNTTEPSPFLDKNVVSANKKMKNKANFNSAKLTATTRPAMVYNNLRPKIQNGTKPNKANFKYPKTPAFIGEFRTFEKLFLRNKANFNSLKLTATTYCMGTYNDLQTKPQNGANPNKAN